MAEPVRYIKLTPKENSWLKFDDAKSLISNLGDLCQHNAFELVTNIKPFSGLEFNIGVAISKVDSLKKQIYSICPDLIISDVKPKGARLKNPSLTTKYSFRRHYAFPLFETREINEDPLSKLLNYLSQINERDAVSIRLEVTSANPIKARMLRRRLISGRLPRLNQPNIFGYVLSLVNVVFKVILLPLKLIWYIASIEAVSRNIKRRDLRVISPRSITLLDKLYEPLFKTKLSIDIKTPSQKRRHILTRDIYLALNNFAKVSGYQQFRIKPKYSTNDIYSASDLASLFHLDKPEQLTRGPDIEYHKDLPLPSHLKAKNKELRSVIGTNTYQGASNKLSLSYLDRKRHLYITGATGSGKSTLLANLIKQDIISGQGLSLIDPHGDLAQEVVKLLPDNRRDDLIYFDPNDQTSPYKINLLETKTRIGTTEYAQEVDQITESIISLMRKVFSKEDNSGHRIEYILRNTIHTAITMPDSDIFTVFRLLTDIKYRRQALPKIKDPDLVNFWWNELGKAGDYQRVKMSAGVTSKIGRFLFYEPAKRVFSTSKSTLDIPEIMDDKKILICNFAKGKLGEDGSKLFSTAILTKLQLAALARVNKPSKERSDHYLYVDEFQNLAPNVLIQMLSEARKYGLYLTMAEQSPSQQDSQSTSIILANVGNLLCFRMASPKDGRLLEPNFKPYLTDNDLNNLPSYHFYIKTVGREVLPPLSGQTLPLY